MTNDQITVSRELLRQALEAIELNWKTDEGDAVKPLLRTALEQPSVEPVACITVEQLFRMTESMEGLDSTHPGYQWRKGWNAALRKAMDYAALQEPRTISELQANLAAQERHKPTYTGGRLAYHHET